MDIPRGAGLKEEFNKFTSKRLEAGFDLPHSADDGWKGERVRDRISHDSSPTWERTGGVETIEYYSSRYNSASSQPTDRTTRKYLAGTKRLVPNMQLKLFPRDG